MDFKTKDALQQFESNVGIRFQLYNSLFTALPFHRIENTGILLSLFLLQCEEGYRTGLSPTEIIDNFVQQYTPITSEQSKLDLLFRFIQYAERQVVLFDALEDAAFLKVNDAANAVNLTPVAAAPANDPQEKNPEVRLVLTAHPTQFYTGSVLGIISDLTEAMKEDHPQKINAYLRQLGRTPFFNKEKPSPFEEAVNLMWYLEHIFYPATGSLMYSMLEGNTQERTTGMPVIRIGFWPGGDRDGNQFVKTETTLKVAAALHRRILRCYHKDIRELKRRLTFKGVEEEVIQLERMIYAALYNEDRSLTVAAILEKLNHICTLLREQHNGLFIELPEEMIGKVQVFGLHFATLDIRQDSSVHAQALLQLAGKVDGIPADYGDLDAAAQADLLSNLQPQLIDFNADDEVVQDTWEVMGAIRTIQASNGPYGCHRYIISHSTSAVNVLEVYALFLLSGWQRESLTVDIVPLFETIEDLEASGAVMQELYSNENYRQHLALRGDTQTIMVGFSDGTKDGGYLMANWAIYKAKEALTSISRQFGIEVVFFDGRGGPPARGGGKTQKFYASMGNNIAGREIQLTIQGQTISSNFGTVPTARYNMEQLLQAGISGSQRAAAGPTLTPAEDELLATMSKASYQAYVALKNTNGFLDYLNEVSPLKYYAATNIGSRPAKRNTGGALNLNDLRAIPYVGAWSQMKQNVPGYYGVGTALQEMRDAGRWSEVQAVYNQSAFFRTLMDNCEMAMKKCFFPLTAYLGKQERYSAVWNKVYDEFLLTQTLLLELSGETSLMGTYPANAASISMRERIVLPLLSIQQYALSKVKDAPDNLEVYEKLIIRCSFGIINAGRNAV